MNLPAVLRSRVAIIDLGSNSARLMVADYQAGYAYRIADEISRRVRLSEGMAAGGALLPAPRARAIQTVRMFKAFCDAHRITRLVPVATAAVRDAANRVDFLKELHTATGLRFRVLSGEDEAYYSAIGVVNSLGLRDGLVMDLGGGSTEVSRVRRGRFERGETTPLGAVRLTEMFFDITERPKTSDVNRLIQFVSGAFEAIEWMALEAGHQLAGVGGTIRALAHMDRLARGYPLGLVNGYELRRHGVDRLIERMADLPASQRARKIPGLQPDRADIILAGALAVREAMRRADAHSLMVCGHGIREGLFFQEFLKPADPPIIKDLRRFSVENLGRLYGYEPAHAAHAAKLALSLFDQLAGRHGFGKEERDCLWAAAQLHDIGTVVDYYDHHRHSHYIIQSAGLGGYSHRETELIGLLCLYHRKGNPAASDLGVLNGEGDLDRVRKLASLLRLSEYLDRSRTQTITRLTVLNGAGSKVVLRAQVRAKADARVEIWEAQRNASLFEAAFDCKLEITTG
jgi:exopolyphosphatase/guanosine-5'-triphosphate,3'-diphosphate pyrophosphatase